MNTDDVPALFARWWGLGRPDAFLAEVGPLLHRDTTFIQPLLPAAHGPGEVEAMFRSAFTLLPDLTTRPVRHATAGDTAFIESDCRATIGRRTVHFPVCDRFVLRDGLIVERRSHYDPGPLVAAVARSPSTWPAVVRARRAPPSP